jgi:phospholipase/lecithinase/hemolysin
VGCVLSLFLAGPASSADFTQVIAFGDSLSDTGNLFQLTSFLLPTPVPAAPYFNGRFSNGPLSVEYMASALNVPLVSYAFAGALTGEANQEPQLYGTGLTAQVRKYTSSLPSTGTDPNALYFLWAGPNDFYSGDSSDFGSTAVTAAANVINAVQTLYNAGARHFFVPLMPDLESTPYALSRDSFFRYFAREGSRLFNNRLSYGLMDLSDSTPGLSIEVFDTMSFIDTLLPQLQDQGFNTTQACYDTSTKLVCTQASQYVFWDDVHPTTSTDALLGRAFAASAVPEPRSLLLQAVGLGIIMWALRRRSSRFWAAAAQV